MIRDKLEQWILLRQSGELDRVRGFLLNRALVRDPVLRRFAEDSARIVGTARAWSVTQAGALSADAIHARIQKATDRRDELVLRPEPGYRLWPILAGAIPLFLALALFTWKSPERTDSVVRAPAATRDAQPQLDWEDHVDAELDALMDMVLSNGADESARADMNRADEETLIRELLVLEGIAI